MPYKSSLDPTLNAKKLSYDFTAQTGREWVQSIGGTYSLFEVAHQAFSKVSDPHDRQEVAQALHTVNYVGISGLLNFSGGPAPGVSIVPLVGVQWKAGSDKFPFEMKVVDTTHNTAVKAEAPLQPTTPA
jgi:branched-chain amino acid transport system substrate-binding protein